MFNKILVSLSISTYLFCGTIEGTVSYGGTNSTPSTLKMDSDPICGTSHSVPPTKENFIMDENNNLKNVIVWLKDIAYEEELTLDTITIDQIGCMYTPHVNAVMTGQKVLIKNSDQTLHNVNSQSKINDSFNSAQPAGVPDIEKSFSSAEDPFYIKCDVHPWMKAWVMVSNHPYFAVTDDSGKYKIDNVPSGTYEIVFWQERLSNLPKKYVPIVSTMSVSVEDDTVSSLDFSFPKPTKK